MRDKKGATLVLGGNFKDVIGEGAENKKKFLTACTDKLSNGNTRDLACVNVRPGSIVVDVEGATEALVAMKKEVQTDKAFELAGFPKLTVERVAIVEGICPLIYLRDGVGVMSYCKLHK